MSSNDTWHYLHAGQQFGPITWDQLQLAAQSGALLPTDLVWTPGQSNWLAAGTVSGLFVARPGLTPPTTPSAAAADGLPIYAGFWRRVAATLLDWLVLAVAGAMFGCVLGVVMVLALGDVDEKKIEIAGNIVGFVISWLYFASMESSSHQATLGKLAMGIKVIDEQGQRIGFGRASLRWAGKLLSGLLLGIGFIMVAFTARKQGLHDILARCLVVKR